MFVGVCPVVRSFHWNKQSFYLKVKEIAHEMGEIEFTSLFNETKVSAGGREYYLFLHICACCLVCNVNRRVNLSRPEDGFRTEFVVLPVVIRFVEGGEIN